VPHGVDHLGISSQAQVVIRTEVEQLPPVELDQATGMGAFPDPLPPPQFGGFQSFQLRGDPGKRLYSGSSQIVSHLQ
jgi:hypothetical protein